MKQERQQAREKLAQLIAEAATVAARKHPLALIFVDIDQFRLVNETYGHDVGDQVLADLLQVIPEQIRGTDTFVKCGGDEYAILAPRTTVAQATALAETIRAAVEEHTFPQAGRATISLGVAAYQADETPASLIERADRAARRAKADGRNRVQVAI